MATKPLPTRVRWLAHPMVLLVLAICAMYFATGRATLYGGDDVVYLLGAQNWLQHGELAYQHADHVRKIKWPVGHTLMVLPVAAALDGLFSDPYMSLAHMVNLWIVNGLSIVTVLAQALLIVLICRRLQVTEGICYLAALAFAFCTFVWAAAQRQYADPTQAIFITLSVWALVAFFQSGQARYLIWCGAACGMVINTKVTGAGYAGLLVMVLVVHLAQHWRQDRQLRQAVAQALAFGLPLLAFCGLWLWHRWYIFGDPTASGYHGGGMDTTHRFATPLLVGLFGTLLSPGKGLFIYSPVLLLAIAGGFCLWRRHTAITVLICLLCLFNIVIHSKYYHWSSGWSWGPRYQLAITPLPCILVAAFWQATYEGRHRLLKRVTVWGSGLLLAAGLVVQGPGLFTISNQYYEYNEHWATITGLFPDDKSYENWPMVDHYFLLEFVPHLSPISGQWWMTRQLLAGDDWQAVHLDPPWRSLNEHWALPPPAHLPFQWDIWWLEALHRDHPYRRLGLALALAALTIFAVATVKLARCIYLDLKHPPGDATSNNT